MLYAADKRQFCGKSLAQLEGVPVNGGELQGFARGASYWAAEAAKARDVGNTELWQHFVINAVNCRIAGEACKTEIKRRREAGEINMGMGR